MRRKNEKRKSSSALHSCTSLYLPGEVRHCINPVSPELASSSLWSAWISDFGGSSAALWWAGINPSSFTSRPRQWFPPGSSPPSRSAPTVCPGTPCRRSARRRTGPSRGPRGRGPSTPRWRRTPSGCPVGGAVEQKHSIELQYLQCFFTWSLQVLSVYILSLFPSFF